MVFRRAEDGSSVDLVSVCRREGAGDCKQEGECGTVNA